MVRISTATLLGLVALFLKCDSKAFHENSLLANNSLMSNAYVELENGMIKGVQDLFKAAVPAILRAQSDDEGPAVINSKCMLELTKMLTGLAKLQKAPLQVLDSFGKLHSAGMLGDFSALGDRNECLEVEQISVNGKTAYTGRYCIVGIHIESTPRGKLVHFEDADAALANLNPKTEIVDFLRRLEGNSYTMQFPTIVMGICIPSTCEKRDLDAILTKVTEKANVTFTAEECRGRDDPPQEINKMQIFMIVLLASTGIMVIIATSYEYYRKKNEVQETNQSAGIQLLLSYSLISTTKTLFSLNAPKDKLLQCFNGMRFFSMCWVILGHTILSTIPFLIRTPLVIIENGKDFMMMGAYNGFFATDTFFFISAVVFSYVSIQPISKYGQRIINIPVLFYRRIIRIQPLAMLAVGFTFLLPLTAYGPVGKYSFNKISESCYEDWWHILIYLQNYIKIGTLCNAHLWYVTVDMHLYCFGVFYLFLYTKNRKLAYISNVIFSLSGIVTTATLVFVKNWPVVIFRYKSEKELLLGFYQHTYDAAHPHYAIYGIGLALGTYLAHNKPILLLSKCTMIIGWVSCFFLICTPIFVTNLYFFSHRSTLLEALLFHSFGKTSFALGLAWLSLMCVTGNAVPINRLLSWKGFIPLNRPALNIYIFHLLFVQFLSTNRTSPMEINGATVGFFMMGFVLFSYNLAIIFFYCFESPIICFGRISTSYLISLGTRKKAKEDKTEVEFKEKNIS